MASQYLTRDGDMVDAICWKHYDEAQLPFAIERVYAANPGLADVGPILPAGLTVVLPDLARPDAPPIIRIWG